MMDKETELLTFEVYGRYPLYFRQALRFILEIGGDDALGRFEGLMSEVFEHPVPFKLPEDREAARKKVTDMVARDFELVREKPDLM